MINKHLKNTITMKKLMLAIALLLGVTTFSLAQVPASKKAATKQQPAKDTTKHLKKNGTPDMRYKANKQAPPVHMKKDSTPDRRYKENKKKH